MENNQAERIAETFNFDKAHRIMKYEGMNWNVGEGGVPSVDRLKAAAIRLMKDAEARLWAERIDDPDCRQVSVMSGGFISIAHYILNQCRLQLLFVPEMAGNIL